MQIYRLRFGSLEKVSISRSNPFRIFPLPEKKRKFLVRLECQRGKAGVSFGEVERKTR